MLALQKRLLMSPEAARTKMTSIKFYCSDGDQVGCGSQLQLDEELPSPAAQVTYFQASCPDCGMSWEVWHDMESGEKGGDANG